MEAEEAHSKGRSLPLELIFECYRLLFPGPFFDPGVVGEKPPWKDVEGLSLASKASRQIILSLWFHVLHISDIEDWTTILWKWKRLYQWTRAIYYTSNVYKTPRSLLEPFRRLDTLRMDLPTTHVTGEGDFDFAAPELLQIIHEAIPGAVVQHLEIRGITWLDPFVMRHIAEGLPNLRTLRFRQPLVWCGLCNTIGAPGFASIPAQIVYEDGMGLPDGYARYLAPLKHLHTVVITTACGEGKVDYKSLFSYPASISCDSATNCLARSGQNAPPQIGWSGECEACMLQLLEDETFGETWRAKAAARAAAQQTRIGAALFTRPPSLRKVEWNLLELTHQNWPGLLPTMY